MKDIIAIAISAVATIICIVNFLIIRKDDRAGDDKEQERYLRDWKKGGKSMRIECNMAMRRYFKCLFHNLKSRECAALGCRNTGCAEVGDYRERRCHYRTHCNTDCAGSGIEWKYRRGKTVRITCTEEQRDLLQNVTTASQLGAFTDFCIMAKRVSAIHSVLHYIMASNGTEFMVREEEDEEDSGV